MLSVSFSLALVAAMLFGIVLPGHHYEVDKFNGQTREPIPAGKVDLVSEFLPFKASRTTFLRICLSDLAAVSTNVRCRKATRGVR